MMRFLLFLVALGLAVGPAMGQEGSSIPERYRGDQEWLARGILDGNLIEVNFRNHAELARIRDWPAGVWPRGGRNRHIDGIGLAIAGQVVGHRAKYPDLFANAPDTVLNPVSIHYFDAVPLGPNGQLWGWLPLPGFLNQARLNPITGEAEPTPALASDPTSWPEFWPDRLNEEDSGWPGSWNGFFGKGVFSADQESYYVIDDLADQIYHLDDDTGLPISQEGVYYSDPSDSTKGGLGMQVTVRIFQWANVLAEDAMFIIYRITNVGGTDHGATIPGPFNSTVDTGLYFTQFADYGLGWEEGDESLAFDPLQDIAYGWDHDGIGTRDTGGSYTLGYTGFAFLESPSRPDDGLDNDEDGITDERRFSGPGTLIEGQDAIRSYVEANYNLAQFEAFNGPLEDRLAFRAGRWWTGDENLDWVGIGDTNGNGLLDDNELLNDDLGRDGLGPNDLGYAGPDAGEADGIPTIGEPNYDELDLDESDQIGLTGIDLNARPFYTTQQFRTDDWMWEQIQASLFPLGTTATEESLEGIEPWLTWISGPVDLRPGETDFFSTAWLFGANENDFLRNRRIVQNIYESDYRFAQPPIMPTLEAQVGDGTVTLSWDRLSIESFDRFTQEFDFEGYRLYKGTDPLLSDARVISTSDGTPILYRPIAQWDLENDITGNRAVLGNEAFYDLGDDTGLSFAYVDDDVTNGITYYYALVAYDRGTVNPEDPTLSIDPQENTFRIAVDAGGTVRSQSRNVAVVVPRSDAAGYISGSANEDLSRPTVGTGTGSLRVEIVSEERVDEDAAYRVTFYDSLLSETTGAYETIGYDIVDVRSGEAVVPYSTMNQNPALVDGAFLVYIENDLESRFLAEESGWVQRNADGRDAFSYDASTLSGVPTDWTVSIEPDTTELLAGPSPYDYELTFTTGDSLFRTPRLVGFLSRIEIPLACTNVSRNVPCIVLVQDLNQNDEVDYLEDAFLIAETIRGRQYKAMWRVQFDPGPSGADGPLPAGTTVCATMVKPFVTGDFFQFTVARGGIDEAEAEAQLDEVAVVPNPYIGAASWERQSATTGRGERRVQFINLPDECTVRIYTVRGELVRELVHEGFGGAGSMWWDLQTRDGQEVAYGMYLYHVDSPYGETTGKFALIK